MCVSVECRRRSSGLRSIDRLNAERTEFRLGVQAQKLLAAIRFVPRLPVSNLALLAAVACYLAATAGFEAWRVDAAMSAHA